MNTHELEQITESILGMPTGYDTYDSQIERIKHEFDQTAAEAATILKGAVAYFHQVKAAFESNNRDKTPVDNMTAFLAHLKKCMAGYRDFR